MRLFVRLCVRLCVRFCVRLYEVISEARERGY